MTIENEGNFFASLEGKYPKDRDKKPSLRIKPTLKITETTPLLKEKAERLLGVEMFKNYKVIRDLFDNLNSERVHNLLSTVDISINFLRPLEKILYQVDSFDDKDINMKGILLELIREILEKSKELLIFAKENSTLMQVEGLLEYYLSSVNNELKKINKI